MADGLPRAIRRSVTIDSFVAVKDAGQVLVRLDRDQRRKAMDRDRNKARLRGSFQVEVTGVARPDVDKQQVEDLAYQWGVTPLSMEIVSS
jgi:hypothetical protein